MADDKLHIRLHVYDAELSVNVPREDEEYYRSAAKLITDTINTYSTLFKGKKGDKDIIYMAMLDIALQRFLQCRNLCFRLRTDVDGA